MDLPDLGGILKEHGCQILAADANNQQNGSILEPSLEYRRMMDVDGELIRRGSRVKGGGSAFPSQNLHSTPAALLISIYNALACSTLPCC